MIKRTSKPKTAARTKRPPRLHVANGWPHMSSKYRHPVCMCLDSCCHNEQGCKCGECICQFPHIFQHGQLNTQGEKAA